MLFIVDECTGPRVAQWLINNGHDVISIYNEYRGLRDDKILELALQQNRIIITNDKDFGEMIFREKKPHRGIIFLRLADERPAIKIKIIAQVLEEYANEIENNFIVVSENNLRIVY